MNILLDSHIFLWWLDDSIKLSPKGRGIIRDAAQVFVSAATFTELSIKMSLGKLTVEHDLIAELAINNFKHLDITPIHGMQISTLPWLHKDPFDRLLIAQAQLEDITIITADAVFAKYDVQVELV